MKFRGEISFNLFESYFQFLILYHIKNLANNQRERISNNVYEKIVPGVSRVGGSKSLEPKLPELHSSRNVILSIFE